jgi:hypothetical protein
MIRSRSRRLSTVAVLACAGVFGALATPAQAFHIDGATYNGTHAFGTVSFTVTPDGSGISRFGVSGTIPGNTCTFSGSETTYVQPLPIVNHAFNDTSPPLTHSGSFNARQSASGTFRIQTGAPFPCSTGQVSWTASTTASPAGSEECQSAQAAVDAAEQKVKKAKKKLKKAETEEQERKAKKKLKKAKNELKAAQAQAAAVCR